MGLATHERTYVQLLFLLSDRPLHNFLFSNSEVYEVQKHHTTDFEAPNLRKGRSGTTTAMAVVVNARSTTVMTVMIVKLFDDFFEPNQPRFYFMMGVFFFPPFLFLLL